MKRAIKSSSSGDGWDREKLTDIVEILDQVYNLSYEIEKCVRGAYTNCHTYEELSEYIDGLGRSLSYAAEELYDESDEYDI